MEYIHGVSDFTLEKASAVTLGKFDGVHTGHQKLISIVKEKAKEKDLLSVAFTFDALPLSLCPQKQQHFIATNSERRQIMEQLGLDVEIEYPFTEELMNMSAEEFVQKILIDMLKAKVVVVGTDYRFGKNRTGDAAMLVDMGEKYGFETIVVEKEKYQDREISSTYIREELNEGHMETANMLLGRPFAISGVVCPGNRLGRQMDIPTMNIYPPRTKLLPPKGVYASITVVDGKSYYGVSNLGTKPTVSDGVEIGVETNLFDYDDEAYGKNIEVRLMHFIRSEMKFDSIESLKKQMEEDSAFAKTMFMYKDC